MMMLIFFYMSDNSHREKHSVQTELMVNIIFIVTVMTIAKIKDPSPPPPPPPSKKKKKKKNLQNLSHNRRGELSRLLCTVALHHEHGRSGNRSPV